MPQVDTEVISRQVCCPIAVHRNRIDVVRVSIGKHSTRTRFNHQFHRLEHGNTEWRYWRRINWRTQLIAQVEAIGALPSLRDFPQLHRFIYKQKHKRSKTEEMQMYTHFYFVVAQLVRCRTWILVTASLHNDYVEAVHTYVPLSPSSKTWYWQKLGRKQAHYVMHWSGLTA